MVVEFFIANVVNGIMIVFRRTGTLYKLRKELSVSISRTLATAIKKAPTCKKSQLLQWSPCSVN
jgi:hypothetical protein